MPKGNRVLNNHVFACGQSFYGAVGIWVGIAERTTVAHNLVHDLPYTGISVGWEWSTRPTPCRENVVEGNHVYNVMNRLCDGGCIYTLGWQPGTVIRGNHLHGGPDGFDRGGGPRRPGARGGRAAEDRSGELCRRSGEIHALAVRLQLAE